MVPVLVPVPVKMTINFEILVSVPVSMPVEVRNLLPVPVPVPVWWYRCRCWCRSILKSWCRRIFINRCRCRCRSQVRCRLAAHRGQIIILSQILRNVMGGEAGEEIVVCRILCNICFLILSQKYKYNWLAAGAKKQKQKHSTAYSQLQTPESHQI